MTGVNIVYFYSNQIVGDSGIAPGAATFMFQGISLVGVLSGMVMTGYLGRKTIMFWFSLIMGALLLGLGFSLQPDKTGVLPLPIISGFVFTF
jgi:Na+/melibiose symporter-like transporter